MNFNYAISQAKTEYDVTGDLEDLQEIGLIAYDKIGNKNTVAKSQHQPGLVLYCSFRLIIFSFIIKPQRLKSFRFIRFNLYLFL